MIKGIDILENLRLDPHKNKVLEHPDVIKISYHLIIAFKGGLK